MKLSHPILSITTPVYNGERFIESCIKNVIAQNCPKTEHIIVDGASTDKTMKIVKKYARKYSHIRWISKKDKGQADAINKGIAMAKGKIFGFLNVDDFYEPGTLNRIIEIFKTLPEPSFVVGNYKVWNSKGKLMHITKPKKIGLIDLLAGIHPINSAAYFYHTCLHKKIGLYNNDLYYTLDFDFELRAAEAANGKYFDEIWGNFRLLKGTKQFTLIESGETHNIRKPIISIYKKKLSFSNRLELDLKLAGFAIKRNLYPIYQKIFGKEY